MKKNLPFIAVFLSSLMLVWIALIVNRIQTACVDMGASGSFDKLSLSISTYAHGHSHGHPVDVIYASAGGLLLLCIVLFALLGGVVFLMSKKPGGKAS